MPKKTHHNKGFSLVELMAILVILAICTTLALPSFGNSMRKNQFKKDGRTLMAKLRGFKLRAISCGKPITVSFADPQFIITIQGGEPIFEELQFHPDTNLKLQPEELYFSPQGWGRPATLTLSRNNLSQTILIDPLTGRPYKKGKNK